MSILGVKSITHGRNANWGWKNFVRNEGFKNLVVPYNVNSIVGVCYLADGVTFCIGSPLKAKVSKLNYNVYDFVVVVRVAFFVYLRD